MQYFSAVFQIFNFLSAFNLDDRDAFLTSIKRFLSQFIVGLIE